MINIMKEYFSQYTNSTIFRMIVGSGISILVIFWLIAYVIKDSKNLNEWYSFPLFVTFILYVLGNIFFIIGCLVILEERIKNV